jgi:hypothetical protein
MIKENIEKNVKLLNKKNDNKDHKNKVNTNMNGLINNNNTNKNNNGNASNNTTNNNININEDINSSNKILTDNKNPANNTGKNLNNLGLNNNGSKKIIERKTGYKNNIKNKNNEMFPILSLESLLNCNNMDETSKYNVKQTKLDQINKYWDNWLIFKNKSSKDYHVELKKLLPPYFNSDVNKTNEFSVRDNLYNPPCPQEFLEHLLNSIILRNELGLYRSNYNEL